MGHLHPLSGGGLSNNIFYRVLIKEDGSIEGPYYQNIGSTWRNNRDILGPIKFSRNGKYLAAGKLHTRMIEVFDFDRCTGLLSNTQLVDFGYPIMPGYFEFSPNERFLYATHYNFYGGISDTTALYQYDLTTYNKTTLAFAYALSNETFSELSLAPDGRIYIANRPVVSQTINSYGTTIYYKKLSVINHPDSVGIACGFEPYSFPLIDSCYISYGLPNYPNFNLEALSVYEADAGRDTVICTDSTNNQKVVPLGSPKVGGVQYQWYPNYNLSSDTTAQPLAFPDSSTWYYVMLSDSTIKNACKTRLDSVWVEVKRCVTGINDPQTPKGGLRVFPNPAREEIKIEIQNTKHKIASVKVYDVAGKTQALPFSKGELEGDNINTNPLALWALPLFKGESVVSLNLNGLGAGLYFIEVRLSNGGLERVKLVKQ